MRRIFFATTCALSLAASGAAQCLVPQNLIVSGGPCKDGIPALTTPNVVPLSGGGLHAAG